MLWWQSINGTKSDGKLKSERISMVWGIWYSCNWFCYHKTRVNKLLVFDNVLYSSGSTWLFKIAWISYKYNGGIIMWDHVRTVNDHMRTSNVRLNLWNWYWFCVFKIIGFEGASQTVFITNSLWLNCHKSKPEERLSIINHVRAFEKKNQNERIPRKFKASVNYRIFK